MLGSTICRFILQFAILISFDIFKLANADRISDKRLCGDRNCQTIISKARTLARHKPTDPAFLPFERGDLIDIYSKSAGSRQDLWGGQLNGRRGYFPRSFVREFKVENPNPQFVIDTEHHVPLEDRLRGTPDGRHAASNPRTVKQNTRHQDTPQQVHSEQVNEKMEEELKVSDKKVTGEPADETDIGDETELADEEPKDQGSEPGSQTNLEAGSQGNADASTKANEETGSPDSTDQSSDKESHDPRDEGKQSNSVKEDPTEIDETELGDANPEKGDTEVDETERDETELEDERDDFVSEDNIGKTMEEKSQDIDKLPIESDTEEVEIDLNAIKETLSAKDTESNEQETSDSEKKENKDENLNGIGETGENKEESVDGKEEKEDVKNEKETKIEEDIDVDDAEGGSMFGSIWSDKSEGKVGENEGIDINHISHSDNAVNSPNPDIKTGDHIEQSKTESQKFGDGSLHVNIYDREDKGFESDDTELEDDNESKDMKVGEVLNENNDTEDLKYTHEKGLGTAEKENGTLENEELTNRSETTHVNVEYDTEGPKHIDNDQNNYVLNQDDVAADDEDEDDGFKTDDDVNFDDKKDIDQENKDIDLSMSDHHIKDEKEIEKDHLDPDKIQLHNSEDIINGVENGNLHLKDILKSSIPEGNDVYQYVVEHVVSDTPVPSTESLGTDSFDMETNHNVNNGKGELPDSEKVESKSIGKDEIKLEVKYGDGVSFDKTVDESKNQVYDYENKEGNKEIMSAMSDENLMDKTELKLPKDDDELTNDKENENTLGEFTDSGADKSDNKTVEEETINDADNSQEMTSPGTKDAPEDIKYEKHSDKQDVKSEDLDNHKNGNNNFSSSSNNGKNIKVAGIFDDVKSKDNIDSIGTNVGKNSEEFIKTYIEEDEFKNQEESIDKTMHEERNADGRIKTETIPAGTTDDISKVDQSTTNEIVKNVEIQQEPQTEKKSPVARDKSNHLEDTEDIKDEAVVSPFQKQEADQEEIKEVDNKESKNVDELAADAAEGEKHPDEKAKDEENTKENVNLESNREEDKENKDADERTEQILDNVGKTLVEMAAVKEEVKDITSENKGEDKDDLKFVDSHGDVILDQLEKADEKIDIEQREEIKVPNHNLNEMEQTVDETKLDGEISHVDTVGINKEQKEVDDKKLENLEKLASGMMSVLATPTYDDSKTEFHSAVPDKTADENLYTVEALTQMISTEAEISETKVSVESVTETVQETDSESVSSTSVEETYKNEPIQDDTRGGGIVIDGTTFDADYFGDEMTTDNNQATEQIYTTPSVVENMVHTPLGKVEPTKLFDIPVETEQTLLPPYIQEHLDSTDNKFLYNQKVEQNAYTNTENIQASETEKEEPLGQDTLEVSVLGTSFGYATPRVEKSHTQPIENLIVESQTQAVKNNETVASDIVQDMVQPSLDQNAYNTKAFISRKPLSTESMSTETSAETDLPNQSIDTENPQESQGESETKQSLDQNNNQVIDKQEEMKQPTDENNNQPGHGQEEIKQTTDENNNIPDSVSIDDKKGQDGWTDLSREGSLEETVTAPTTDNIEQLDPYSSVDHLYTRKVPDQDLDEELRQPDEHFMKTLEPYLKSMINMLPPSLQTVLEQEPLGLSPTLTMLVCFISTNVLALLTCVGCLCKGKKKQPGRKDPLVVIRELEEKLFIATKEKENLEDDIQIKNKKVLEMQDELSSQQSSKGTFETDLKTVKLHNESLKKQLAEVQIELDEYKQEVTEKSQVVVYKDSELQTYMTEIQSLTTRAEDAELALQKISHNCSEKEEELRLSLQQVQSLSEQIQQLETSKQQLNTQAVDWSEKVKDLTEQVEQFASESKRMQEDLAFKENELEVLRDCFLQVKAFQGEEEMKEDAEDSPDLGEKLKQMMDVSRVNASLRSVEEERDVIQNKLLIEVESRKELEDQVQLLKRKFESNQTDKMKAERQCQEAQTKLEVLSKYFKEKEAELTRQLGEQEVLKNQNISKLQSSDSITQELSKENETYRQQIEDLKTEISKAERDFRSQIAANEKKAHENWLATRAAERELKESRHECGMLRQKLTDLERKLMQGPPPGLIRPITHRAMPPPGMLNGPPPPPPPERPGSRGSVHGHVTPRLRDDDYRASPIGPERMPPPPDRRHPPGAMGPRPPPPPLDAMSPPPYAIRPPFPPDRRSPPSFDRYPPPRGPRPPFPRPPPPHLRSPPPMGSNPSEHDDSKQDSYSRAHPGGRDRGTTRHQSQV